MMNISTKIARLAPILFPILLVAGHVYAKVLVLGNNAVDHVFTVDTDYADNGKRLALERHIFYGGKASNVAFTLAQLIREPVTYIGVFASDDGAVQGRRVLEQQNVQIESVSTSGDSNCSAIMLDKASGERLVTFYPALAMHPSRDEWEASLLDLLSGIDLSDVSHVYSDSELTAATRLLFRRARALGIPCLLDLERLDAPKLELLWEATVLIGNGSVLLDLASESDLRRALESVAETYQLGTVIASLGEKGHVGLEYDIDTGEARFFQADAEQIDVVDSTGAGDAFHAGFIAGVLRGYSVEESAVNAGHVAARACQDLGPKAVLASK
ncbi:MAG: carbohydrate kinase family protein [Chlamydiia bacterium]|nr:carbohydrate kinase family protein [Chlamydiia bacterium]